MERIIKGVSDALGVKRNSFYSGPPAVHNDKALSDLSTQVATKMNLNIISPSLSMAGRFLILPTGNTRFIRLYGNERYT